jgi:hypothetical protein
VLSISIAWIAGLNLSSEPAIAQQGSAVGTTHAAEEHANPERSKEFVPEGTPGGWAEAAVRNELKVIAKEGQVALRYRQRKVDAKGDTTREVIESKDGNVARLVERNGQPLTADEDAAERDRLGADISSPDDFFRHEKRENANQEEVMQLVRLMPQAMIYSYAPGAPQTNVQQGQEVVLDFHPNPAFRPPTMYAEMLTGLEGRVWIDARSQCIRRVEAHVLRPVNFGFGVLAKIFPGGTVELEQTHAAGDRWVYSHVAENLTARVLMVRTVPENAAVTSWDFRPMASPLPYQDAIRTLLSMSVPVH